MLVGTLIPALALLVLFGRRLAIRRAGGTTARLHVNLVFFFSPTDVAENKAPQGRTFRIGGLVEERSVRRDGIGLDSGK